MPAESASLVGPLFDGIGALIVGAIGSAVVGRLREVNKDREKVADAKAAEDLTTRQMVAEMYSAMITPKPTPFTPNPPPGLIDQVAHIRETLFSNGGAKNTVLDRLGRIEKALSDQEKGS